MADSTVIERPIVSGATDFPDAKQSGDPQPPPVPAGYSDTPQPPPVPAGYSDTPPAAEAAKPAPQSYWEGVKGRADKVVNAATAPLLPAGRAEKEGEAYADSAPTMAESNSPIWTGVKKGVAGAYGDTMKNVRGMFTSPLGIATLGAGGLAAEGAESVPTLAKAAGTVSKVAGAGFGAQGLGSAYQGGKQIAQNVEDTGNLSLNKETAAGAEKLGSGLGMATLAGAAEGRGTDLGETPVDTAAGIKKLATIPVRGAAKAYNAARNAAPYAIPAIGAAEGLLHGGPIGAVEGAAAGTFAGNRIQKLMPEASETTGLSKEDSNLREQQKAVKPLQKALDAAQKEHDSYAASEAAGEPIPEKVVAKLEKAKAELTEQQKHLDLAEQAAANAKAGRPNAAPPQSALAKVPATAARPAARTGEALATAEGAPQSTALEGAPTAKPASQTGEALGGTALRNPLTTAETPAATRAAESGEALANVKPTKAGELGAVPPTGAESEPGYALGNTPPTSGIAKEPGLVDSAYTPPPPAAADVEANDVAIENRRMADATPEPSPSEEQHAPTADKAYQGKVDKARAMKAYNAPEPKPVPERGGDVDTAKNDNILWQRAKGELNKELGREPTFGEINDRTTKMKAAPEQPKYRRPDMSATEGLTDTMARDKELATPQRRAGDVNAEGEQLKHHEANGGSTFSAEGKNLKGSGKYVVGSYPERTEVLDNLTPETLKAFKAKNADLLSQPDHTTGTWKDNETGKHVVDVSKTYDGREEAIAAGKAANQKSIYHLSPEGEEIPTGGTGEALPAEAPKAEAEKPAEEPKAKVEAPSDDDTGRAVKVIKDHADQQLIKLAGDNDIDHGDYDFSARTEKTDTSSGRGRYRRDALAKDVATKLEQEKPGMTAEILEAQDALDNKDSGMFSSEDRSIASRAERARVIMDKANENWESKYGKEPTEADVAAKMAGKGPAPEATAETAKMSNEDLLKKGFTQEDIDAGLNLPKAGGGKEGVTALPEALSQHLTKDEIEGMTTSEPKRNNVIKKVMALPDVQEFTDIALKGEGARKWYQRSRQAFTALSKALPDYFKEPGDQEKFTDFLAAGSPQQSVKMNLQETLRAWTKYVDMDRPTGKPLEDMLNKEFTMSGTKTPNAMKALAGENLWPDISKNSNFKVPSFAANLRGWLNHVTNDGWQGLFGGIEAKELSAPDSYHPLSAATRAAAEALGWEPAEAQAAIWAFTKAFTEGIKGGMSVSEAGDSEYVAQYSKDFADIIANDKDIQRQLEELGVNKETLDGYLKQVEEKPKVTGRTTPTTPDSVTRASERIQSARELPSAKDESLQRELGEGTDFNPEKLESPEPSTVEFPKAKENLGREPKTAKSIVEQNVAEENARIEAKEKAAAAKAAKARRKIRK